MADTAQVKRGEGHPWVHPRGRNESVSYSKLSIRALALASLFIAAACDDATADAAAVSGSTVSSSTTAGGNGGSGGSGGSQAGGEGGGTAPSCPPEVGTPTQPAPGLNGCEDQAVATPVQTQQASVDGVGFLYRKADNPKGLLLIFHGGGGSKEDPFERVEMALFVQAAIAEGYSVAALDSIAHINPPPDGKFKWNEDSGGCQNPDIANTIAMIRRLKDAGDLAAASDADPVFAVGVSNGGSMVSRTAQHVSFSAVSTHITNAKNFFDPGAKIPPVSIVSGLQDSTVGTTGPCMLLELAEQGKVPAEFHLNTPEPITPGLFVRIAGIDCESSKAVVDSFIKNGVIDPTSKLLTNNPSTLSTWKPHVPKTVQDKQAFIRDILLERYAEHAFTSEFSNKTLAFFAANASSNSTSELPVCN